MVRIRYGQTLCDGLHGVCDILCRVPWPAASPSDLGASRVGCESERRVCGAAVTRPPASPDEICSHA